DGAVAVVGGALHQDGHSAGAVALEGDVLVGHAFQLAGPLLDGALDVVGGHVHGLGLLDRGAQAGVRVGVTTAEAGGDRQLADDLGEDLAPLGIEGALLVLDGSPLGMSGHRKSPSAVWRMRVYHPPGQQKSPDAEASGLAANGAGSERRIHSGASDSGGARMRAGRWRPASAPPRYFRI